MSKVNEIKISMEVLNSMSPQKGLLTAKKADLENQVFTLHSIVVPSDKKSTLDSKPSEDNLFVKARYVNSANKKSFLIPIRGLLNLDIAQLPSGTKNVKYDAETTATMKVHEFLMEGAGEGKAVLPQSFTVLSVEDRKQESTGRTMYPPYCYDAFSDRVKELRDADPKASLDSIYQDYDFMQGLYAEEPSSRFANAEATKQIVISI